MFVSHSGSLNGIGGHFTFVCGGKSMFDGVKFQFSRFKVY